jgi:hypothetical protein
MAQNGSCFVPVLQALWHSCQPAYDAMLRNACLSGIHSFQSCIAALCGILVMAQVLMQQAVSFKVTLTPNLNVWEFECSRLCQETLWPLERTAHPLQLPASQFN